MIISKKSKIKVIYYYKEIVLNCKNIDELVKDFQTKISSSALNKNLVKRNEELNILDDLRRRKDPNRIYNSKIELEDQFTSMQVDLNEFHKISATSTFRNFNVRYPVLIENATIAIIRDKNLMMKAGGFEYEKAYNELEIYSRLGL
jgi:hypothetical protein